MTCDATTVEVYPQLVEDSQDPQYLINIPSFEPFTFGRVESFKQLPSVRKAPSGETTEIAVINTASPWYADGIKKLSVLQNLEASYDGYGTRPPNAIAAEYADSVLSALADLDFEPSAIDPSSDEGICISFRNHNLYADVECFNTGEVLAETKVDGEEPTIWAIEPQEINETITKINSFILG